MKALILNSGTGSRMSGLPTCKCLSELADGVTILDAQIAALLHCGVSDIIITTGPHTEVLEKHITTPFI
jgi:choline kinase